MPERAVVERLDATTVEIVIASQGDADPESRRPGGEADLVLVTEGQPHARDVPYGESAGRCEDVYASAVAGVAAGPAAFAAAPLVLGRR